MPAPVGLEEVATETQYAAVRRQLAGAGVPWHTDTGNLQQAKEQENCPLPPLTRLSPAGPSVDQRTDTSTDITD